jgi:hypothetical protein
MVSAFTVDRMDARRAKLMLGPSWHRCLYGKCSDTADTKPPEAYYRE